MERRFELRKAELVADCEVRPAVFAGMMSRLERFAEPFAERLRRPEQREHAPTYVQGLLSDVEKKNAESIAYRHPIRIAKGCKRSSARRPGTTNRCWRNGLAKSASNSGKATG